LFWLQLFYLILLIVVYVAYQHRGDLRGWVPSFGELPVGVPWFGAVGAVLIGLTGIFIHSRQWDPRYNYWHVARPLVGAVVGSVACLILIVLVDAANTRQTSTNPVFYYVAAFLVGYREATFRTLITRATRAVFPGEG
jgi:hypothetical protein